MAEIVSFYHSSPPAGLREGSTQFEPQRDYFRMRHRLMAEDRGVRASSAEHSESRGR